MKELSKEKTVIMVTHSHNYLLRCDEVLVMKDGTIMVHGPPS
jgi:ABC-type transport system involved in cytochrome bd biosynthesis fused ATPase/permease subunit